MLLTKIMFKDKLLFFNVQCHWCFRIRIGMLRISLQHFHSLFACRGGCVLEGYIHATIILESHPKNHAMPSYIIGPVLTDYQHATYIANVIASTSRRLQREGQYSLISMRHPFSHIHVYNYFLSLSDCMLTRLNNFVF